MTREDVLALIRAGALEQAEKAYLKLTPQVLQGSEDSMVLRGRLLKARALEATGEARQQLARKAAELYGAAFRATMGTYSGINTAALCLIAGDLAKARQMAQTVLSALGGRQPAPGLDAYYHTATRAEALLVLGEISAAENCLSDAIALAPHDYEAQASTIKQFEMLLENGGQSTRWLDSFRPPPSLHFAGHMWGEAGGPAAIDPTLADALERAVDNALAKLNPGAAYGALAAGADIIIAERLLARGIDLHVVQPCPDPLFVKQSLAPFGEGWLPRFEACLSGAVTVRHISGDTTLADDLTRAFASETAMGLSVLRAEQLATSALQLLVWDGETGAQAGTAHDAARWKQAGRPQITIPFTYPRQTRVFQRQEPAPDRQLMAMLFADVSGFGCLSEAQVPSFIQHILQPLAASCDDQHQALKHVNTWGDGLFLVFDSVEAAAQIALALQDTFQQIDLAAAGLPETLALRVSGHYAPVHKLEDPFLRRKGVFGREVTTAARIEPIIPVGSIYVSEPFACALAVLGHAGMRCEPMPETINCRDRGEMTLFSLRRTHPTARASE